jgi:hypothetical protein
MPGPSKLDCDVHDLLDEAHTLHLSADLDVRKTATLIARMRECAEQARDAGMTDAEQKLRKAAEKLEKRLLAP